MYDGFLAELEASREPPLEYYLSMCPTCGDDCCELGTEGECVGGTGDKCHLDVGSIRRPDVEKIIRWHYRIDCGCCAGCSLATIHEDGNDQHQPYPCDAQQLAEYVLWLEQQR